MVGFFGESDQILPLIFQIGGQSVSDNFALVDQNRTADKPVSYTHLQEGPASRFDHDVIPYRYRQLAF